MSFMYGYLTLKQRNIWSLFKKGLSQSDIANKFRISRQTVNKTLTTIRAKLSKALMEAARINRIEVRRIDPLKGILVGYSPDLNSEVVITFSAKNGIQVWYKHEGNCENCRMKEECMKILLSEAEERGIKLSEEDRSKKPSELAKILFSKILSEVHE